MSLLRSVDGNFYDSGVDISLGARNSVVTSLEVVPWYGRHHVKRASGVSFRANVVPVYDPIWLSGYCPLSGSQRASMLNLRKN